MKTFEDKVAAMYAPLGEYVPKVIRLMLFHIWDLAKRSGTSAGEQFDHVTWLARLVTLDRRVTSKISALPEWIKVRTKLVRLMDECNNECNTSAMEQSGLEMLLPLLKTRFQPNYVFPEQPFHHVWYTMHEENELVAVHFINADMPKSPFEDMEKFAGYLLIAIENACSKFPAIQQVECGTWMNDVAHFLRLWPESYQNSRYDREDTGGFGPGWWGQYLTAAGGFNEKTAAFLRTTGKHLHPLSIGRCPIEDILAHLKYLTD
ncbi:MAG: hypothetical protein ABFD10_00070 [Prolixibacteraceae bacterium]